MGDMSTKVAVAKLKVDGDGRSSPNWAPYSLQIVNSLIKERIEDIPLRDVLLNRRSGKQPADPGDDQAAWINQQEGRDAAGFLAAQEAYERWDSANRWTHAYIMGTLPDELQEEAAQREVVHEFWTYLQERFGGETITSVAALWSRLTSFHLSDYPGVSAFLTAITKVEGELRRAGQAVPSEAVAGAILVGMGDKYPTTRELLLTLPASQQTKEVFSNRLLEAEKNAAVAADLNALHLGHPKSAPQGGARKPQQQQQQYPRCGYVRKHNGRGRYAVAGRACPRRHPPGELCWSRADDAWLAANPGKGPMDLPIRHTQDPRPKQQQHQQQAAVLQPQQGTLYQLVPQPSTTQAGHFAAQPGVSPPASSNASSVPEQFEESNFLGYLLAQPTTPVPAVHHAMHAQSAVPCPRASSAPPVVVALDSGATTSCFRQGTDYRKLHRAVTVKGALPGQSSCISGTTSLPCPALPGGRLRGLHNPSFRHNLVSLSELQQQGVEVLFPANTKKAVCKNPRTGKTLWVFQQGHLGLYEATVNACTPTHPKHPTEPVHSSTQTDTAEVHNSCSPTPSLGTNVRSATAPATTVPTFRAHQGVPQLVQPTRGPTAAALHPSPPIQTSAAALHPTVLLHHRLGHMSESSIRTLIRHAAIQGLPKEYVSPPVPLPAACVPCIQGKTQAQPHPTLLTRAACPLARIHVDLVGPLPTTQRGHRYWLTIVDDYSRYGWTILLTTKAQAKARLLSWMAWVQRSTGRSLQAFHADRGGEFMNSVLMNYFREQGITWTFSNPHTPQQNGVAEARNKQTGRFTRTLLLHSQAPTSLWGYAAKHATIINNLVPHSLLGGKTPYELWHSSRPSTRRLRVWGCVAHALVNKEQRQHGKLGPVTKQYMLVGLNPAGPGWLLLDPSTKKEVPCSDVVFQEHIAYSQRSVDQQHLHFQWSHFQDASPTDAPAPAQGVSPSGDSSDPNRPGTPSFASTGANQDAGGAESESSENESESGGVPEYTTASSQESGGEPSHSPDDHSDSQHSEPNRSSQDIAPEWSIRSSPPAPLPLPATGNTAMRSRAVVGTHRAEIPPGGVVLGIPARRTAAAQAPPSPATTSAQAEPTQSAVVGARGAVLPPDGVVLGMPARVNASAQTPAQPCSTSPQPASHPPERRSLRLQGLPPDSGPATELHTILEDTEWVPTGVPPSAVAYLQTVVAGDSGNKTLEIPVPTTWEQALGGEYAAEWLESMVKEFKGLEGTGTFRQVPRSEARSVLKNKWVFRVKRRADGTPLFKSRLVVKGYSQQQGIDYAETWAPTAKPVTWRLLLHLAAQQDFHIRMMDVDQAFCQGDLEEDLHLEPPKGLPAAALPDDQVWKLLRPLYGLKQAPRQWHAKLKEVLGKVGFRPVHGDSSLFMHRDSQGFWVLAYVDDLLLLSKSTELLDKLKEQLKEFFPMKDLGDVQHYLGMEVTRNWEQHELYLSQAKYIEELLTRFGYTEGKEYNTPLALNHGLRPAEDGDEVHPDQERYPELLGGVMYLMVCTRPDIAHAVSVLARYIAPGRHCAMHWQAALRLLGYLKATANLKLVLGGKTSVLVGHSDSSYADDQEGRRSSQGYCFSLGSGVISWKATRSPVVALSTCEAELYAVCSAAQEAVWLTEILTTIGCPQTSPPMLWCDNKSTVVLTQDPVYSARSKHIEARYFFVRELVQAKRLRTAHIPGVANVADIFTKPLNSEDHSRLTSMLGLRM